MFNLQGASDEYFKEVEDKLIEETDYVLELQQSEMIRKACAHIENLKFPKYYPELSCEKIITMDWMEGIHLSEFCKTDAPQEMRNKVGQALWDFYMFQIHELKYFHADPHPGNFLVDTEGNLMAIDFGCMKKIPNDFYVPYFDLAKKENLDDAAFFNDKLYELEILKDNDSAKEIEFFSTLFHDLLTTFTKPFQQDRFDFSDTSFSDAIAQLSEKFANDKTLRKMNGNRGSKHFIYVNRTFFGLYSLLFDLKADIDLSTYNSYIKEPVL